MRKGGGEVEVRLRLISIELDGIAQSRHGLLVAAESELGVAREVHPDIGLRIARAEAKGLFDMSFSLFGETGDILG